MKNTNSKSGFTIIEVVLVLAIAGLIFLIVFLAVPALQRSQRDTQRRNDGGRLLTYLSNYQSNNRGSLPTSTQQRTDFEDDYAKELTSPSTGSAYDIQFVTGDPSVNQMFIATGHKCSGESFTPAAARNVAVRIQLEGGGYYCTDQ